MALMAPEDAFRPKHHLMWHLLERLPIHGAPKLYACWKDESLNKLLKACCRQTSQLTFEASVLSRMNQLLTPNKRAFSMV